MGRRTPRGGGASTSGLVLCEEDSMPKDGCFHYKRGTLTDPLKRAENDFDEDHPKVRRTMDPDVAMMRNDALVEKLREEDENRRKPISRDVEDMRRLRQKLKSFDAAERKEREERRARLTRKKNRISGFVDARVGSASGVPRPPRDSIPVRAVDGFIFGQLALAVYAFRKTRAPFVASLAALAFAGTARAFFTENWRIVVLSGIFGAFFGAFVLSMPILEKVVDESVSKDLDDDGEDEHDGEDEETGGNKGRERVASYRKNFVERNGVFVGKYRVPGMFFG